MGMLATLPVPVEPVESVVLTLANPAGTDIECLTVPATLPVVAGAIIRFANAHGISPACVRLSMLWQ